jgi:hypothetical protein
MKTVTAIALMGALAGAMSMGAGSDVAAQSRTIQGESKTAKVEVVAIERSTRSVTVKDDTGVYETVQAGPGMARFDQLKVGDTVTLRYYDNVVVRLKRPGEAAVDVDSASVTRAAGAAPGATAATQRTMTVTVTSMDPKTSAVTVKGPNGYVYSRKVADKKVFAALKVGDQLDMTWTEAFLISVDPPQR